MKEPPMSSPADPNSPVVLVRVGSELEASLIVGRLRDEGIPAEMTGMLTAGFRAEAPGDVRVLVRAQDLERAGQVLADLDRTGDRS
jgi:hypothetical protein